MIQSVHLAGWQAHSGLLCEISVHIRAEDCLWVLLKEVKKEILFHPICRTSLNIIALEGIGQGSAAYISTASGTKYSLVQCRQWVSVVYTQLQILCLYDQALRSNHTWQKLILSHSTRDPPCLSTEVLQHLTVSHLLPGSKDSNCR